MGKKIFLSWHLLLLLILSGVSPAIAKTIYYDNSSTNWNPPYIHYWDGSTSSSWPGEVMTKVEGTNNIWKFELPDDINCVLFHQLNGSQTDDFKNLNQTGVDEHVFTSSGDTGKTLEEYTNGDEDEPIFIYADVPSDWTNLYAYVYIDNGPGNGGWPGAPMTWDESLKLWTYQVPSNLSNSKVILCSKDNQSNRYPANQQPGMDLSGKSMIYHESGHVWEEYTGEIIDPDETIEYTIYFHNNVNWQNVFVKISGVLPSLNKEVVSHLNSTVHALTFEAPRNANMRCSFYTRNNGSEANNTEYFNLINGHIYTISGDKGLRSEYNENQALPEMEYWLEPSTPSVNDRAVLYFNRAYVANGPLRHNNNIEVYCGLIAQGEHDSSSDETWYGCPTNFTNPGNKFKMTQSSENQDLFYLEFTPSLIEWFATDDSKAYTNLAIIIKSGNIKQHDDNIYIPLRTVVPVGDTLGAVLSYEEQEDHSILITSENGTLQITPWSKNVIKVFTLRNNASNRTERESISVIDDDTKNGYGIETPSFNIQDGESFLRLVITDGVNVIVNKQTSLLHFYNMMSETPVLSELAGLQNKPGNIHVSFEGMNDQGFYGGGYNGNLINWEGYGMKMNNNQQGGWEKGGALDRNICIPFYVSTNGYGIYFDDHYKDANIYPTRNGSTYSSKSEDPIAYYFIGGGDMVSVLENYTTLTGRQELPPYWALGYITSKFGFATDTEAKETITKTKDINIPIDGIVFDINWQSGLDGHNGVTKMGKIDWDYSAYSRTYNSPIDMMDHFVRDYNVHTIAITEPYFTSNSGNYDYLKNNGLLADDDVSGMGWLCSDKVGLLDVTHPQAIDWFKDLYKNRTREGIESWWLDLGEPEKHDFESTYLDGNFNQVHNEYGLRWIKLAYDAVKEATPDKRFITMPRAGTSGMQRYNTFPWTGDIRRSWGGLQAQVPSLVSAAMSGVSYLGSDIGGFTADGIGTDANLYRRWVQLGVFYPSMRTHSATAPEVWQAAYSGVRNDVRDAINLRYAYLPYTYSQAYAYTAFGTPIARPANYNDSDKSVLANEIGAYYWGPDVYVAPVLDNSTTKSITFPEGDWLDMNDFKTIYHGHQHISYNAPTNVLPHFMRRGAFVPRYAQDTFSSTAEIDHTRLIVDYFVHDTEGMHYGNPLYQDDMETVDPLSTGNYLLTTFRAYKTPTGAVAIYIDRAGNGWSEMPEKQDITFRVHGFSLPGNSEIDETLVNYVNYHNGRQAQGIHRAASTAETSSFIKKNSADDVANESTAPSYHHDTASNTLYLRIPNADTAHTTGMLLGTNDITTGVYTATVADNLALFYAQGNLNYSVADADEITIDIYSITGEHIASYCNLEADGYTHQINLDQPAGVYIATLRTLNADGQVTKKSTKIIL